MIIDDSIKIKNYKCFGEEPQGFEKIYPINIIIGKNNSGKSSLIDLIKYCINTKSISLTSTGHGKPIEIQISHILNDEIEIFPENKSGGGIEYINHREYGKTLVGSKITYKLLRENKKEIIFWEKQLITSAENYEKPLTEKINLPFANKIFRHISAERDIIPEENDADINFSDLTKILPNGIGTTRLIQFLINRKERDSKIIETTLLKELNLILSPEIEFTKILVQVDEKGVWEIYFENKNETRIALSKMGSGLKTVLSVLVNLIVLPGIGSNGKSDRVFAFEELENNLHPALLRRLFSYIKKYSEENKTYFFITTHSSIVIDFFGNNENAQIVHITNDGQNSKCTTFSGFAHGKHILKDLDVRASDLLQSNGIIWVEGPSDRIYINKWISLLAPELEEGLHYSIMFYGGKLLANLELKESKWFEEELVPLLKINTNAFVVIDRDGDGSKPINATKTARVAEIGEQKSWVTNGREIENYLTDKTLNKWLFTNHGFTKKVTNNINAKLENNIADSENNSKLKYNNSKKEYAIEIVEHITAEDLTHLDLKEKLELLIGNIKAWNGIAS